MSNFLCYSALVSDFEWCFLLVAVVFSKTQLRLLLPSYLDELCFIFLHLFLNATVLYVNILTIYSSTMP